MTAPNRYAAELEPLARASRRNAVVSALSGALIVFSFLYARAQYSRVQAREAAGDSIFARLVVSSDSLHRVLDSLEAKVAAARALLVVAQRDTSAKSAQQAVHRASSELEQVSPPTKQTSALPTADTLETVHVDVPFTGVMNPGSPVVATIRLPYQASLTYRRWISRDKVDTLGSFGPAKLEVRLPYGGYLYFEARNAASGDVAFRAADCRYGCTVSF